MREFYPFPNRRYLMDDCGRCRARLEVDCLIPGGNAGHVSVRCRVCGTENVFADSFQPLATSSPRIVSIRTMFQDSQKFSTVEEPTHAVCVKKTMDINVIHDPLKEPGMQTTTSCF